jgi:hypothetical protein
MISYAGIGSRQISDIEKDIIFKIANRLCENYVLFSRKRGAEVI